jgi:hypothetical protein
MGIDRIQIPAVEEEVSVEEETGDPAEVYVRICFRNLNVLRSIIQILRYVPDPFLRTNS